MLISVAVFSTVQLCVAGVASALPAASTARTRKLWLPSPTLGEGPGGARGLKAAPSRLHSKLESVSVAENVNRASGFFTVPVGPETIVVSGGVVSALLRSFVLWT